MIATSAAAVCVCYLLAALLEFFERAFQRLVSGDRLALAAHRAPDAVGRRSALALPLAMRPEVTASRWGRSQQASLAISNS